MPWVMSQMWMDALSGGKLNMKMVSEQAEAIPLKVENAYKLYDPEMNAYGRPFNPALVVRNGQLYANVRVCSHEEGHSKTTNFFGRVKDGHLVEAKPMLDQTGAGPFMYGYEDLRLFHWQGALWAIAAVSTHGTAGSPRTQQCLVRVDGDGTLHQAQVLQSKRHEKNWMPCVSGDELRLVYSTEPLIVLTYTAGDVSPKVDNLPDIESFLRGGAPLQPYKDGWITVIHQIHSTAPGSPEKSIYVHRFVVFDQDLRSAKISEPFNYKPGIEFAAGLVHHEGKWLLGMGVRDEEAWVLEISEETVDAFASGSIETPKHVVKDPILGTPLNMRNARLLKGGGNISRPAGAPAAPAASAAPPKVVGQPENTWPTNWNPMLGGFPPHGHK